MTRQKGLALVDEGEALCLANDGSQHTMWIPYASVFYLITKDRTISAASIAPARTAIRFRSEYT